MSEKREPKKLSLNKESVRNLDMEDLDKAAGGISEAVSECYTCTCNTCLSCACTTGPNPQSPPQRG
jgi:hypothetical protein